MQKFQMSITRNYCFIVEKKEEAERLALTQAKKDMKDNKFYILHKGVK